MPVKKRKRTYIKSKKQYSVKKKRSPIKKTIKRKTMAKKKTSKRRHTGRRISGTGSNDISMLLMVAGGALLGRLATAKLAGKVNPKILGVASIGAAIFLPKMVKSSPMIKAVAAGVGVNGVLTLATSFGIVSGIAEISGVDEMQMESLSGTDQLSILAGPDDDGMGAIDQEGVAGTDKLDALAGATDFQEILSGMNDDGMGEYE